MKKNPAQWLVLYATVLWLCAPLRVPDAQGYAAPEVHAQARAKQPAAKLLETGDLVWPKTPGALVPFRSPHAPGEEALWLQEKERYMKRLEDKRPDITKTEQKWHSKLKDMTYREFLSQYMQPRPLDQPNNFGSEVYVGHVGIIRFDGHRPFVIEAVRGKGVRSIAYSDWLAERPGELVWLGRLTGVTKEKRAQVAEIAAGQIGQPYDFWNFDLKDTSGFYCSKLAWFAINEATGIPPDYNYDAERHLWYSPKMLMHSPRIRIIHNPGNYTSR